MKRAIFAALVAVVGAPAAIAQPLDDGDLGVVDVRYVDVYTGDLQLSDSGDRDEATWRIDRATHFACQPYPDMRAFDERSDYRGCRFEAFDEAMTELEERAGPPHRRGSVRTREYLPRR